MGGGGGLVLGCLMGRNVRDPHWALGGVFGELLKILSCDWWKAGNWFLLLIVIVLNWGAVKIMLKLETQHFINHRYKHIRWLVGAAGGVLGILILCALDTWLRPSAVAAKLVELIVNVDFLVGTAGLTDGGFGATFGLP